MFFFRRQQFQNVTQDYQAITYELKTVTAKTLFPTDSTLLKGPLPPTPSKSVLW